MNLDPVRLTQELVRLNTVNQGEDAGIAVLAPLLEEAGFAVTRVPWRPGRSGLVATFAGGGDLVFSGHLDTVPFEVADWSADPLGGELADGRLFGRGSSDMKAGLAAMVVAAVRGGGRGFHLAITAAEEVGCLGAPALLDSGLLPADPVLVIGESTGNTVRLGHKGAVWLEAVTRGVSAHGSRPDLGVNAIDDLVRAAVALGEVLLGPGHPRLGEPTTNLGTISGGQQTNLVPDAARMTVDLRTVPGTDVPAVTSALLAAMERGEIHELLHLPVVWTDETDPVALRMAQIVHGVTGQEQPAASVSYFTDAALLAGSGGRAVILGPGDLDQPHTVDESCSVARIEEAVEIYGAVLEAWGQGRLG